MVLQKRSGVLCGCLILLFCFSCWLRIESFRNYPSISRDAVYYLRLADDALNQRWNGESPESDFYSYILPFLPQIAAKISSAAGCSIETAWRSFDIILSSLLPVLIYLIARQLKMSRLESFLIGFLASVHPLLLKYSLKIQREIFFIFWETVVFYFVLLFLNTRKNFYFLFAGMSLGLALAARYEALFLLAIIPICLFYGWKENMISGKNALGGFCLLIVGFVIPILGISWISSGSIFSFVHVIMRKIGYFLTTVK